MHENHASIVTICEVNTTEKGEKAKQLVLFSCFLAFLFSCLCYKKIPRVERLCPLCNRSEIGDEFHYLLKCTLSSLSHIRGIFLETLYSINSNFTNMSYKTLLIFIYHVHVWSKHLKSQCFLYWKYSKLLCVWPLIKLSYHTSSVKAVHSQVFFFSFMTIFNKFFLSFLLNFYFTFFICYCFGTKIFMSKIKSIKSIKLLLLS